MKKQTVDEWAKRTADDWIAQKAQQRDDRVRRELKALNKVMAALLRLPEDARPRVLRFLYDKYVLNG